MTEDTRSHLHLVGGKQSKEMCHKGAESGRLRPFLKALCQYYLEFLETDFRKQRPPRRRVDTQERELLTFVRVHQYPGLASGIRQFLRKNAKAEELVPPIEKGQYELRFPSDSTRKARQTVIKAGMDRAGAIAACRDSLSDALQELDIPNRSTLLTELDEAAEERPAAQLARLFEGRIIGDLNGAIREMQQVRQLHEGHELYLYVGAIGHGKNVYPVAYLPLNVEQVNGGAFRLEPAPVLYFNTKALLYITQTHDRSIGRSARFPLPQRRQYVGNLAEISGGLLGRIQQAMDDVSDYFGLDRLDIGNSAPKRTSGASVSLATTCYLAVSDKADEALINDYEKLLDLLDTEQELDEGALGFLAKLANEYMNENPESFEEAIVSEFDELPIEERLTYRSPIPLNREQKQILAALRKKGCDRIVVEGPPGTGKSHTISAIIYSALLHKQSVLVVSDKKEALDVVEEKIGDVLSTTAIEDFVQQPIMRLGKSANRFNAILRNANIQKIQNRQRAYDRDKERFESAIDSSFELWKTAVRRRVAVETTFRPENQTRLAEFEKEFGSRWSALGNSALSGTGKRLSEERLVQAWNCAREVRSAVSRLRQFDFVSFDASSFPLVEGLLENAEKMAAGLNSAAELLQGHGKPLILDKDIGATSVDELDEYMGTLERLRNPVFGFLFKRTAMLPMNEKFAGSFPQAQLEAPHKMRKALSAELKLYRAMTAATADSDGSLMTVDVLAAVRNGTLKEAGEAAGRAVECCRNLVAAMDDLVRDMGLSGRRKTADFQRGLDILGGGEGPGLLSLTDEQVRRLAEYFNLKKEMLAARELLDSADVGLGRDSVRPPLTMQMTNILDESVVRFNRERKNDAQHLRKIIRQRKEIPESYLPGLVGAFPCLLVGVRELGDYLPILPDLFDVVIIDEASQVSIAQALPAILRGRKVVVFGDNKQYSNVKSHNAAHAVNNALFSRVKEQLTAVLSEESPSEQGRLLDKVVAFDVKRSVLDFVRSVANYHCTLRKHFRGYPEIIGYSNKRFYQSSLQVMKIRLNAVTEVIQFHQIEADPRKEVTKNTNRQEMNFILAELEKLREEGYQGSVGVITPFTNQQRLLARHLQEQGRWDAYVEEMNLKVMTFDSCQGDEKDIIFYSMVEKPGENILRHIFPVNMETLDDEDEGSLKAQRLNVGLSRAKESVRFVVSKPATEFTGEIGHALRSFAERLEGDDVADLQAQVDPRSPMEAEVLNYLMQTPFVEKNRASLEIRPQFKIGEYLRQLDPGLEIPAFRVDFLVLYVPEHGKQKAAIVEYDGVEYHFKNANDPAHMWWDQRLVERDVERQLTLESYGYPFIRLNKFVLGDDPVSYINQRLVEVFKKKTPQ